MAVIRGFSDKVEANTFFRQEIATGNHTQIVMMSIEPGSDIGKEVHEDNDQILMLVSGAGKALIGTEETDFEVGDVAMVPSGTEHNFTTVGDNPMKIITFYSPAHHPVGTVHQTKADAEAAEAHE